MKTIHFKNGSTLEIKDEMALALFEELKNNRDVEYALFLAPNGVEIDIYINVKEIVFID